MLILVWQCSSTRLTSALSSRSSTGSFMMPLTPTITSSELAYLSTVMFPWIFTRDPSGILAWRSAHSFWFFLGSLPSFRSPKRILAKSPSVSSESLMVSITAPVRSSRTSNPTTVPSTTTLFSSSTTSAMVRAFLVIFRPKTTPSVRFPPPRLASTASRARRYSSLWKKSSCACSSSGGSSGSGGRGTSSSSRQGAATWSAWTFTKATWATEQAAASFFAAAASSCCSRAVAAAS